MKKISNLLKQIIYITFFIIFFFIILNLSISISWKFYSSYKINKTNPFPEFVRSNFELSNKEQIILFKETKNLQFKYIAFQGAVPKNYESKYVNFKFAEGRRTTNTQNNCENKIVFFGGSTTFGWLSIDDQTIPSHFSRLLKNNFKNYCVYNYGLPSFYSQQENNLLLDLYYKNIIKPDVAIFLDGLNETCYGHTYDNQITRQFDEIMVEHRTDLYKKKIIPFLQSTPLFQLLDRLLTRPNTNFDYEVKNCSPSKIKELFQSRIKIRQQICNQINISCFTFLQPFGGINGNLFPFNLPNRYKKKFYLFKQITNNLMIDISDSIDPDKNNYSYVDRFHYSHDANRLIASSIFEKIAYKIK